MNNSSANIKLSKSQLSKIVQSERFLGRSLELILKTHLSLVKNVVMALELTAAASTTDAAIQNKIFGLRMIILIISNGEIRDILKIVKSLK